MNRTYDCPNCGGAVPFQSSVAVFAVCPYCRSMIVRHDVNVEAIGTMAALPPDLSPLQIGATGEIDGHAFTLIGRVRMAYEEGSWNEWCALFGDGRQGWVAEAQGFFMVSFESELSLHFPTASGGLPVGRAVEIQGEPYQVTDRKESTCLGSEGEVTFVAPPGRKAESIDLTGQGGRFANAEYSESGVRLFVGRYARFEDLKFANLRPVPGWTEGFVEPIRKETTSLQCPNCGAAVALRAAGFTMSATCGSCDTLIDTSTPELSIIRNARERQKIEPPLPLGRRGVLFEVNYEVIGFQHVKDQYSGWFEYLLFNPWHGFVWLVSYNGHWTFVRRLFEQPEVDEGVFNRGAAHAKFQGERYRIFADGLVSTDYVVGEFYWKVKVGMNAHVTDYVAPPRVLSREAYPNLDEQTWSQGEYVEPQVIQKAFNLETPLREPTGVYLNQPNRYLHKARQLLWVVPVVVLLLLVIQMISSLRAAHRPVFEHAFSYHAAPVGTTNATIVSEPFQIEGGNQALEFFVSAPVDNNWLELDVSLVNAETRQEAANILEEVAYYHGYDDGNWSEGNRQTRRVLPGIPPGKYYLVLDASAEPTVTTMPFTVGVVRDVIIWSNFWIALALVLIYPIYIWTRSWLFERARWLDSDYAPVIYAEKSDADD